MHFDRAQPCWSALRESPAHTNSISISNCCSPYSPSPDKSPLLALHDVCKIELTVCVGGRVAQLTSTIEVGHASSLPEQRLTSRCRTWNSRHEQTLLSPGAVKPKCADPCAHPYRSHFQIWSSRKKRSQSAASLREGLERPAPRKALHRWAICNFYEGMSPWRTA